MNTATPQFIFYLKYILINILIVLFTNPLCGQQDKNFIKEKATKRIFGILKWKTSEGICECTSGNCWNQYSRMIFGDNCQDVYKGEMQKGWPINGEYSWQNGDSWYKGRIKNGIPEDNTGKAKMKDYDGTLIEGGFRAGTVYGAAKISYPDGAIEEGKYDASSKLNGKGSYRWTKGRFRGSSYNGNFVDSRFSGYGEMILKVDPKLDNSQVDFYSDDKCVISWPYPSYENRYVGEWENCNFAGIGVYYSETGNVIKSGYWGEDDFVLNIPEHIVLDSLNKMYGTNHQPRSEEFRKKKEEQEVKVREFISGGLTNIKKSLESDTPGKITVDVEIKDTTSEFGIPEKYLEIEWDIDTIFSQKAEIEKTVYGNYPSGSYLFEEASNVQALLQAIHNSIKSMNMYKMRQITYF